MTPGVRPGTSPGAVVLDNEAAQALADTGHPKHRLVMGYLDAIAVRKARGGQASAHVPTTVRVEAGIDRRDGAATSFNRLQVRDVPLCTSSADGAAALRSVGGSTVDAVVARAAADLARDAVDVVVLTADLTDIPRLVAATDAEGIAVRRI